MRLCSFILDTKKARGLSFQSSFSGTCRAKCSPDIEMTQKDSINPQKAWPVFILGLHLIWGPLKFTFKNLNRYLSKSISLPVVERNSQKPPVYKEENATVMVKVTLPFSPKMSLLFELHGEQIWHKWILCSLQCDKIGYISSRYKLLRSLLSCLTAGPPVAIWYTQSVILNVICHLI